MGNPRSSHSHQRKLKNYLLDPSFQLRYANFAAAIVLVLSSALGVLLWRTSIETLEQSQAAVQLGKEVLSESRKVSEVVRMNIVQDPTYADNPILRESFERDAAQQDRELAGQQKQLQLQAVGLEEQRGEVAVILIVALSVLVVLLWLAAIVLTHKVAGPIYKMRRQLRELEAGNFRVPSALRKGDQLKEFFDAFNDMVRSLRARQEAEIAQLNAAIDGLGLDASDAQLAQLLSVRDEMVDSLEP